MTGPSVYMPVSRIAEVFEEWQRQWQEDPEGFAAADEHFAMPTATYGERAAATFVRIVVELEP